MGIIARPARALPLSLSLQHQPCLVAGLTLKLPCLMLHGVYEIRWFLSVTATIKGMAYTEELTLGLQGEVSLLPNRGLYASIY